MLNVLFSLYSDSFAVMHIILSKELYIAQNSILNLKILIAFILIFFVTYRCHIKEVSHLLLL